MNPSFGPPRSYTGMTAEAEIPQRVVQEVLPNLENWLSTMLRLQAIWNTPGNHVTEKIVAAFTSQTDLGGYDPKDFVRWGTGLQALQQFLATPIDITFPDGTTEQQTLDSILHTRYVPMSGA